MIFWCDHKETTVISKRESREPLYLASYSRLHHTRRTHHTLPPVGANPLQDSTLARDVMVSSISMAEGTLPWAVAGYINPAVSHCSPPAHSPLLLPPPASNSSSSQLTPHLSFFSSFQLASREYVI
jgi:hypothetical protein